MKNTACPSCRKSAVFFFRTRDRNREISSDSFDYFRCESCGFIFLNPIPVNLGDYYPSDYYGVAPSSVEALVGAARINEGYKIEILKRFVREGKLLEIGPSMGGFALMARAEGFDVQAIEMSERCCTFLNDAGIPTVKSDNEIETLSRLESVDVLVMWQVIEHLKAPLDLIRAAIAKIKSGGLLIVAAPNPESLQFRLLKGKWVHVDAPRHVSLIPLTLLKQWLARDKMDVIFETTSDEGAIGWNRFGWEYSLSNLFHNSAGRRLGSSLGTGISRIFDPVERRGRLGTTYTVVARKL